MTNRIPKSGKETVQDNGSDNDNFVAGKNWPLIPDGTYLAQCIHFEKGQSHHNSLKLFLHFRIYEGQFEGSELFKAMNLTDSKTGKEFKKVPRGSKYYEAWVIANFNELPARGERMPPRIFKNGIFEVKTRTVKPRFTDGREKPECFRYSVVDYLIQRLA